MRRTAYSCAALALLCAATPAIAAAESADLQLDASVERTPTGQDVVAVRMSTTADGRDERVTVRAHLGEVPCRRRGPLLLPARETIDVLFGVRTRPRLSWDGIVRFVAPRVPRLTLCGFVVSEAGTRFGRPYVRRTKRTDVLLAPAATPPPVIHRRCTSEPGLGLIRLEARRRGTGACTVARWVADAWLASFRSEENPRDNWNFGWRTPAGSSCASRPRDCASRAWSCRGGRGSSCAGRRRTAPPSSPRSLSTAGSRPSGSAGPEPVVRVLPGRAAARPKQTWRDAVLLELRRPRLALRRVERGQPWGRRPSGSRRRPA